MVRIIKKTLGKTPIGVATEMARPTPSEGWHDMARYAVPLYLLAGELKESIGAQLAEGPEVIVDLDIPAPIRELWLDLIHSGTFTGGDFNASRAKFFSGFKGLKRAKLRVEWVDEPLESEDEEEEEEDGWYRLDVYAGRRRVASRRLRGFTGTWDFDTLCWLFHRCGVRSPELYRTLLEIEPGMASLFTEED